MVKVKLITGIDGLVLEHKINAWLKEVQEQKMIEDSAEKRQMKIHYVQSIPLPDYSTNLLIFYS